ncbi:hypothetical protein BJ742DRAFT_897301 [Cladochytrium replicatum]|nr:hypothetical protein BJ742DRAFT_897301 [Cladochytrium replicatum]
MHLIEAALCAPPNIAYGNMPPFSVTFPVLSTIDVSSALEDLSPSPNARVFVIDSRGQLIANNIGLEITDEVGTSFVSCPACNDTIIAKLCGTIREFTVDFTNFTCYVDLHLERITFDNEKWTYSVRRIPIPAVYDLFVVAAIPRKDYFTSIDEALSTSIVVTVVFALVATTVMVLGTVGVVFPVSKLTKEMGQIAKFNFSMLEEGFFVENSFFVEIQRMQVAFDNLVIALSNAVKRNKIMTMSRPGQSAQNTQGRVASSTTTGHSSLPASPDRNSLRGPSGTPPLN